MIQNISTSDVHRITSGQVITDLVSVTKEIVENSIDANSSQIEIIFGNYGVDSIDISDNGDGIQKEDFDKICLKHCTSKLVSFEDISNTTTLGFRGEAMSSLCALLEVKLVTCTEKMYPVATELEFDSMGVLINQKQVSGKKGTSSSIKNLFQNLPVRRKDFQKHFKREFNKAILNLTNYSIIHPQIRFTVFNVNANGKKNLILSTQGGPKNTILKNMVSIFGTNGQYGLIPFNIETDDIQMKFKLNSGELPTTRLMKLKFEGFISNHSFGLGRSSTDRQFFYINGRPVNLKKFGKCINEVYRTFNNVQYPVVIFNMIIDNLFLDINVTPDKRTILIHNEETVIEVLREALGKFFNEQGHIIPRNDKTGVKLEVEVSQRKLEFKKEEKATLNGGEIIETTDDKLESSDTELLNFEINESAGFKVTTYEPEKVEDADILDYKVTTYEPKENVSITLFEPEDPIEEEQEEEEEEGEAESEEGEEEDEEEDEEGREEKGEMEEEGDEQSVKKLLGTDESEPIHSQEQEFDEVELINEGSEYQMDDVIFSEQPELIEMEEKQTKLFVESREEVEEEVVEMDEEEEEEEEEKHEKDTDNYFEEEEEEEQEDKSFENIRNDSDKLFNSRGSSSSSTSIGSKRINEDHNCCQSKSIKLEQQLLEPQSKQKPIPSIHNIKRELKIDKQLFLKDYSKSPIPQTQSNKPLSDKKIDDITKSTEAENKLTLTVLKSDFLKMKIIGQFNLGFILVTRPPNNDQPHSDLFIIDQHASDEKFNFEKLQETTIFQSQPLVIPQNIELSAIDELIVLDNLEIFKKNGFNIKFNEDELPGQRIKLISLPLLKQTIFDLSDFHELVHLVKQRECVKGMSDNVRCSKIRSMFALRACRSSIMIGQYLNNGTMERVVNNLAGLDKPWNCPHGRPTMRHLMELKDWKSFQDDYTFDGLKNTSK